LWYVQFGHLRVPAGATVDYLSSPFFIVRSWVVSIIGTFYTRLSLIEPYFRDILIKEGWTLDARLVFLLLAAISLVVIIAA